MHRWTILTVILSAPLSTACGDRERPRVEILTPDRSQFADCLALDIDVPALPPYEAVTLPDGRRAVLLERVRERDAISARLLVMERSGRVLCQAAVRYADDWTVGVKKGQ